MVKITAQKYLLSKYASFNKDVNLNYGTPDANFTYVTEEYDTEDPNLLKDGQLFVETLLLSNDPAQKGWFGPTKSYVDVTPLNDPAPARGLVKVLKSKSDRFQEGDVLNFPIGWVSHNVITPDALTSKVDPTKVSSLSHYISVYGGTTITAYLALYEYSGATPEEEGKTWLVTGAAGAVGSVLIHLLDRLFKPKKIIAVAGGAEKLKYVESISDKVVAVDYKSKTYDADFKKAVGDDEINYFVDQVGGELLDKAVPYLADHGVILQVGFISKYNGGAPFVFNSYPLIITKRLTVKGFVIVDNAKDFGKIVGHLIQLVQAGKLDLNEFKETFADATGDNFKKIPELWTGLFRGINTGKYITKVNEYKL
jgi:NADPH-dependent curcumin reductase CurA